MTDNHDACSAAFVISVLALDLASTEERIERKIRLHRASSWSRIAGRRARRISPGLSSRTVIYVAEQEARAHVIGEEGDEFPDPAGVRNNRQLPGRTGPIPVMDAHCPSLIPRYIGQRTFHEHVAKDARRAVIVSQGKSSPRCVIAFEIRERPIRAPARAFASSVRFRSGG